MDVSLVMIIEIWNTSKQNQVPKKLVSNRLQQVLWTGAWFLRMQQSGYCPNKGETVHKQANQPSYIRTAIYFWVIELGEVGIVHCALNTEQNGLWVGNEKRLQGSLSSNFSFNTFSWFPSFKLGKRFKDWKLFILPLYLSDLFWHWRLDHQIYVTLSRNG